MTSKISHNKTEMTIQFNGWIHMICVLLTNNNFSFLNLQPAANSAESCET